MKQSSADIQVEKGKFTRIHNMILEKLAQVDLSSHEFRCLMFLFRQTYGFQRKEVRLSLSEWEAGTGIDYRNVDKALKKLQKRNIVVRTGGGRGRGNVPTYAFSKYFERWEKPENSYEDTNLSVENIHMEIRNSGVENSYVDTKENSYVDTNCTSGLKKEKKVAKAAMPLAERDGDEAVTLVRMAYDAVGKFAPSHFGEDGRGNIKAACDLIERYGMPVCVRGVSTLRERNDARIRKNARDSIRAPVGYLRTILEAEYGAPAEAPLGNGVSVVAGNVNIGLDSI